MLPTVYMSALSFLRWTLTWPHTVLLPELRTVIQFSGPHRLFLGPGREGANGYVGLEAASHLVAFTRKMTLGPLCYAQKVITAIPAIPFRGDLLLGLSLSLGCLQTETEKAKQAKEDVLLCEKSSSLPRTYTP